MVVRQFCAGVWDCCVPGLARNGGRPGGVAALWPVNVFVNPVGPCPQSEQSAVLFVNLVSGSFSLARTDPTMLPPLLLLVTAYGFHGGASKDNNVTRNITSYIIAHMLMFIALTDLPVDRLHISNNQTLHSLRPPYHRASRTPSSAAGDRYHQQGLVRGHGLLLIDD